MKNGELTEEDLLKKEDEAILVLNHSFPGHELLEILAHSAWHCFEGVFYVIWDALDEDGRKEYIEWGIKPWEGVYASDQWEDEIDVESYITHKDMYYYMEKIADYCKERSPYMTKKIDGFLAEYKAKFIDHTKSPLDDYEEYLSKENRLYRGY